jgi:hypothetical protein
MFQRSPNLWRLVVATTSMMLISPITFAQSEPEEEAYTKVINERAAKMIEGMTFSDPDHGERVKKVITDQYRTLRDLHVMRDTQIAAAKESQAAIESAQQQSKLAVFEAHNRFLSRLNVELACDQVEQVKDGLTYGVVSRTYDAYLAQLPELKDEQKRTIRALLIEARELAMDGGSADEKHGVFRKYKGKINNFLSAAGYKM